MGGRPQGAFTCPASSMAHSLPAPTAWGMTIGVLGVEEAPWDRGQPESRNGWECSSLDLEPAIPVMRAQSSRCPLEPLSWRACWSRLQQRIRGKDETGRESSCPLLLAEASPGEKWGALMRLCPSAPLEVSSCVHTDYLC